MLIVKVPGINGLHHTDGCEHAPGKILEHLKEIYSSELNQEISYDVSEISVNTDDAEASNNGIRKQAAEIFKSGKKVLFLGGDHSISYPLMKAFSAQHANACVIIFDAHADSMHNFTPPTHEDWLRTLIEEGFNSQHVTIAGLRNVHAIESEFLTQQRVRCFPMKSIFQNLQEVLDEITEHALQFDAVYLSIDIDAADSLHAPGTGYPEPGGFSARELIYAVQRLKALKNLKAIDIVEVNPEKDINGLTARLAAKLAAELC